VLYAAIDIHKHAFQAAVFDPESGEVTEARLSADRESLSRWSEEWRDHVLDPVTVANVHGHSDPHVTLKVYATMFNRQRTDEAVRIALAGGAP
jgi:hypothetical protein